MRFGANYLVPVGGRLEIFESPLPVPALGLTEELMEF